MNHNEELIISDLRLRNRQIVEVRSVRPRIFENSKQIIKQRKERKGL